MIYSRHHPSSLKRCKIQIPQTIRYLNRQQELKADFLLSLECPILYGYLSHPYKKESTNSTTLICILSREEDFRNPFFPFLFPEQPAEVIPEGDSCLFAGFYIYKGIQIAEFCIPFTLPKNRLFFRWTVIGLIALSAAILSMEYSSSFLQAKI